MPTTIIVTPLTPVSRAENSSFFLPATYAPGFMLSRAPHAETLGQWIPKTLSSLRTSEIDLDTTAGKHCAPGARVIHTTGFYKHLAPLEPEQCGRAQALCFRALRALRTLDLLHIARLILRAIRSHSAFRDAMSIVKRYFTSDLSSLS